MKKFKAFYKKTKTRTHLEKHDKMFKAFLSQKGLPSKEPEEFSPTELNFFFENLVMVLLALAALFK